MTVQLKKGPGSSEQSVTICHGVSEDPQTHSLVGRWVGPLGDSAFDCKWHTLAREFIGAADASPKNLGNRLWEVPLECGMECASEADAWSMYYSWAAELPYDGTRLVLVLDNGGTVTYGTAEISELDMSINGCFLIARYKFLCGHPTVAS